MTPITEAPPAPVRADHEPAADAPRRIAVPGLGPMTPHFRQALATILAELQARDDVAAILFFGSVQRGTARHGSDLDLLVVTRGTERWAECRWVDDVEVQLQFGPAHIWRMRVEQGQAVVINAFATGELRLDRSGGEAPEIKRLAEAAYALGPRALTDDQIHRERFDLTNMLRDLEDLPEGSVEARMLSWQLVIECLRAWCAFGRVWSEKKPMALMRNVRARDASLAGLVEEFSRSGLSRDAIAVADAALDVVGGRIFEFSTVPKPA